MDDDLVVVSKPPGMTVHRGARSERHEQFVLQTLSSQIGRFLYPVHRLDRNTSGALAFALSSDAARRLQTSLAAPETRKEYLALVRGVCEPSFVSERPLTNDRGERHPARTECECVASFSRCSLLRIRITTGRHHQIRRHLNHLAHHVIGDTTHGKGRINQWFRDHYGLPRMFLHASRLAFAHPVTGAELDIECELATDLREFLARLPDAPTELFTHSR